MEPNPCRSGAIGAEVVRGGRDEGCGPLQDVGVTEVVAGLVRDVGPEREREGMGNAARVSELTPLTGHGESRAGCGVIPVYSNSSLVGGLICGSWASCRRRESLLYRT